MDFPIFVAQVPALFANTRPAGWRCASGCQGHRRPLTGTNDPTWAADRDITRRSWDITKRQGGNTEINQHILMRMMMMMMMMMMMVVIMMNLTCTWNGPTNFGLVHLHVITSHSWNVNGQLLPSSSPPAACPTAPAVPCAASASLKRFSWDFSRHPRLMTKCLKTHSTSWLLRIVHIWEGSGGCLNFGKPRFKCMKTIQLESKPS